MKAATEQLMKIDASKIQTLQECQQALKRFKYSDLSVFSLAHQMDTLYALQLWMQSWPTKEVESHKGILSYTIAISGVNIKTMVMKPAGHRSVLHIYTNLSQTCFLQNGFAHGTSRSRSMQYQYGRSNTPL